MPQVSRLAAGRTVATLSVWAAGWAAANAQRLGCGVSSGKRSRFGLQGGQYSGQYSGQQLRQRAALGFFFPYRWAAANARRLGCGVGSGKRSRFGLQGEMRCWHQRGCWHGGRGVGKWSRQRGEGNGFGVGRERVWAGAGHGTRHEPVVQPEPYMNVLNLFVKPVRSKQPVCLYGL